MSLRQIKRRHARSRDRFEVFRTYGLATGACTGTWRVWRGGAAR